MNTYPYTKFIAGAVTAASIIGLVIFVGLIVGLPRDTLIPRSVLFDRGILPTLAFLLAARALAILCDIAERD